MLVVQPDGDIISFGDERNDVGDAIGRRLSESVHQKPLTVAISSVFWMDIKRVLSGVAIRGFWVEWRQASVRDDSVIRNQNPARVWIFRVLFNPEQLVIIGTWKQVAGGSAGFDVVIVDVSQGRGVIRQNAPDCDI